MHPKCEETITLPNPEFPTLDYMKVTHVCDKEPGHSGKHKCRKRECGFEWDEMEVH